MVGYSAIPQPNAELSIKVSEKELIITLLLGKSVSLSKATRILAIWSSRIGSIVQSIKIDTQYWHQFLEPLLEILY